MAELMFMRTKGERLAWVRQKNMERNFLTKTENHHAVEKILEKSGLEPNAPNRLSNRKHCALSTQSSPSENVGAREEERF